MTDAPIEIPLILSTDQLPASAQKLWNDMVAITSDRQYGGEHHFLPGQPLPRYHEAALQLSNQLFEAQPGFIPNHLYRAQLFRECLRLPEAEAEARFVVATVPCHPMAHLFLKQLLAARGAIEEGEAIHAQCAALCPELPPFHDAALYLTGQLRYMHPEEAVQAFRAHLADRPESLQVAEALIELQIGLERYEEAEASLGSLIEANPFSAPLHVQLGSLLAEREELERAIEEFRAALEIDPANSRARVNLARAYTETDEMERALKLLRAEAESNSGDADYNLLHGELALALDQEAEAGAAFVRALTAEPEDPEEVEEIEQTLTSLGLWNDRNVKLQYLLAERALDAGEGLRAIKHLTNVKESGVDTRELYMRLAEAHHAMNLIDDPLNYLVLAKSKKRRTYNTHGVDDPSDARLDVIMLSLLTKTGRYSQEEAQAKLKPYAELRKYENEPEGFFLVLADCWAMAGNADRAREALCQAILQNPTHLVGWTELAHLLEAEGEPAEAVRAWQHVWQAGDPDAEVAGHLALNYRAMGQEAWASYYEEQAAALGGTETEE